MNNRIDAAGIASRTTARSKRARALLRTQAAGLLNEMLIQAGVSRAELARRLQTSRAHVTQLLSGHGNLTLHTLADVATACHCQISLSAGPATPPG